MYITGDPSRACIHPTSVTHPTSATSATHATHATH